MIFITDPGLIFKLLVITHGVIFLWTFHWVLRGYILAKLVRADFKEIDILSCGKTKKMKGNVLRWLKYAHIPNIQIYILGNKTLDIPKTTFFDLADTTDILVICEKGKINDAKILYKTSSLNPP